MIHLKSVDSTNEYIKRETDIKEYEIVIADIQNKGKGTRGRNWISKKGGAWFSFYINKDRFLDINDNPKLSLIVGLSVLESLEVYEKYPYKLKWVNDIYLHKKKLAGILLELDADKIIIGIGINVNNQDFGEFQDIAVSMKQMSSKEYDVKNIAKEVVQNFKKNYFAFLKGNWNLLLNKINENTFE